MRPAVPLQEDPGALVAQQPQLRAAVGGRAVVGHLQLAQPAQFFVRKRSSEKSEVLVTMSVLEAKSCGAETVPELVTSPQTTLPVDTPPLVAVKVQSRLSQSSGPAEAAPVMVSVAPVSAPVAAKLAAVAAPDAVSVPVDTSPTVVKFPALAVLLMVNLLPVIPVAELSRPTPAAPVMLSELPDTAPVDDSVAPATAPVAVSAAQETAPEASTVAQQLVAAHVALRGEPVQRGRAREGQRVRQQVRHEDRLPLEGRGPDLHAVQLQRARRLLRQPGDQASEGSEVQLRDSVRRRREVQACRAPDALRGRAEEGAGDAHVVVVGRADVHLKLEAVPSRYRQPKE